jgi:hypothetical protein
MTARRAVSGEVKYDLWMFRLGLIGNLWESA